jgi:hypothetical protein
LEVTFDILLPVLLIIKANIGSFATDQLCVTDLSGISFRRYLDKQHDKNVFVFEVNMRKMMLNSGFKI